MVEDRKWYADMKQKVAEDVVSKVKHPATKETKKVPASDYLFVERKPLLPKRKEVVKLGGREALERIKLSMIDDDLDDEELVVKGSAIKSNPSSKMQGKKGQATAARVSKGKGGTKIF